jgi:anti-sigma-K factor RskA
MVMEHDEALERIEIAAAEPEGLERLMAGDTADAAAVAGHLAGCAACTAELARIRRTAAVVREVVRTLPDPELRARTLAFVRETGVPRGAAAAPAQPVLPTIVATPAPVEATAPVSFDDARRRRSTSRLRSAVTVLAAALVIAVGGGVLAYRSLSTSTTETIDQQAKEIEVLEATTRATLAVSAQPDAERIALAPTSASGEAAGTLLYSPSTGELVAVASGLEPAPAGSEYGCWIEVDGTRTRIGKMYGAGDVWAWAGPVDGLADVPAGATFGVSLAPVGGGGDATPVLTGEL